MPFNLDPSTAKQMAALQATSLAKAANRSVPGGTSAPYFGGLSYTPLSRSDHSNSLPDAHAAPDSQQPHVFMNSAPTQQNTAPMADIMRQRKRGFLNGLANVMTQRNTPLPPALTGVPLPPNFDPAAVPWKSLEINPNEVGVIKLAGKDVDLYRLWAMVLPVGGGAKVSQRGAWGQVCHQFELPETLPTPNAVGEQLVAAVLERYYSAILGPFEEMYRKNAMEQAQRQNMAGQGRLSQGGPQQMVGQSGRAGSMMGMPGMNGIPGGNAPGINMMSQMTSSQSPDNTLPDGRSAIPPTVVAHAPMNGSNMPIPKITPASLPMQTPVPNGIMDSSGEGEINGDSKKRKFGDIVEMDAKRARQKTGGSEASDTRPAVVPPPEAPAAQAPPVRTIRQPSRRKIEYVPYAREVDTAGGRDLEFIQQEWQRLGAKPPRHIDEWGQIDIEALTLSLRSRITTELSYSLTTFTLLTLMRNSNHKEGGFPVVQAPELFEEALDLIEDLAFDGEDDIEDLQDDGPIITHRELLNSLVEDGTKPFAGLERVQGSKDPDIGPRQRPGDIILIVINILRNLAVASDNQELLGRHERFVPILLRLASLKPAKAHDPPLPLSPILTVSDLISIRKDVLNILLNLALYVNFSSRTSPSRTVLLTVRRALAVVSSFIADPVEAVSPLNTILLSGVMPALQQPKPPTLADTALEVFTRLTHPDDNREVVAKAVPVPWLWTLMQALIHRLPVADSDFKVIMREVWLAYVERLVMAIYSLAFLAPPTLKRRIKKDHNLAFAKVMLRLVKQFALHTPQDVRAHFAVVVRRAVEALKVVDDAADSFDSSRTVGVPTLTFGVGWGEHGDNRVQKGMGLLSGYQDDITLGLMMHPDVADAMLFSELESLSRIG